MHISKCAAEEMIHIHTKANAVIRNKSDRESGSDAYNKVVLKFIYVVVVTE